MPLGNLLSFRRPRISVYLGLSVAAALAGAVGLEIAVRDLLKDLSALPPDSPDAAVLHSAAGLTGLSIFFAFFCLLVSGALLSAFRRAVDERRLPPSGAWPVGPVRPLSGSPAVRLAKLGMGLAVIVGACGVAFGITAGWFVSRVLACAARTP